MKAYPIRLISFHRSRQKNCKNRRTTMNKAIRLALIGASILALASPALARSGTKGDHMMTRHTTGEMRTAPVRLHERAPEQLAPVYGWGTNGGYDRASSPYAGGVS
jgi:hypothetical protein